MKDKSLHFVSDRMRQSLLEAIPLTTLDGVAMMAIVHMILFITYHKLQRYQSLMFRIMHMLS